MKISRTAGGGGGGGGGAETRARRIIGCERINSLCACTRICIYIYTVWIFREGQIDRENSVCFTPINSQRAPGTSCQRLFLCVLSGGEWGWLYATRAVIPRARREWKFFFRKIFSFFESNIGGDVVI